MKPWHDEPTGPAWQVPFWQRRLQQSVAEPQDAPAWWQASQVPWLQMSEQHSLARVQAVPSSSQLPQVPL